SASRPCRGRRRSGCCFFQAEDGIRGFHVTGVQTCALPIYPGEVGELGPANLVRKLLTRRHVEHAQDPPVGPAVLHRVEQLRSVRSEERRVGKEWRSGERPEQSRESDAMMCCKKAPPHERAP